VQLLSELELDGAPDAVPTARRFAASALSAQAIDVVEDAELLVAELVTNALLHGDPPIMLRILHNDDHLRIEVEDSGNALPVPARPNADSMTGRGLSLIAALSRSWGVDRNEDGGKVVWAELATTGDRAAGPAAPVDVEELLKSWEDFDAAEARYTLRLGAVPTDLLLAAKAHIDNVVRELTLAKADEAVSGVELPPPVAALVETVTTDFAEARADIKRQALAAAARGDGETELVLSLPLSAAAAGERYLAALDEADRYARAARLLTLAAPRSHRVFRRWYVQSLVDQLRALAAGTRVPQPRPFPQVLADEVERLASLEDIWDRLQLLQRVTAELTGARTVSEIARIVVDNACEFLGAQSVRVYLLTEDGMLRALAGAGSIRNDLEEFAAFDIDADLPGAEVARTGEPLFLRSVAQVTERYPALAGVYPSETRLHVAPMTVGEHTLGVMSMSFAGSSDVDEETQSAFVGAMTDALAQALERALALEREQTARRRLAFLADASVALSSSLDFQATLDAVTDLFVPTLADWCLVQLRRNGDLAPVALRNVDPERTIWAKSIQDRYPLRGDLEVGAVAVARTGRSEFYPELAPEVMSRFAVDDEHREIIEMLGMCSAIVVPLTGRIGTFGAITLLYADSNRRYVEDDVRFVEDVARRAALALETAERFREQSGRLADVLRVAEAAQRAILAPVPPRIGPISLAGRYVSASAEALVGGDIYEIIQRPDAVRLLVGDVRGKGLAAVRTATIVLGEFRAAAADVDDLGEVAAQIDRRLRPYLADEDFVTAAVAEVANDGRFAVVSCGHPPPLVVSRGRIGELALPHAVPLGLGAAPEVVLGRLEPGDRILLYTDGVIEARDASGRFVELPQIATPIAAGDLHSALDDMLDSLHDEAGRELGDDLALLIAEYRP
jgi:serine phosphatase RsbU (regulator of sigma subunit)/anti-sigma regulatory factor (Ser/Thr protein kinase)